ncbi:MAG TPA: FkbM family methyltransferase [Acetobacteraceae bacterium]|nr:FkbM family methyltransferase [Acetobacteraceae bacterium]
MSDGVFISYAQTMEDVMLWRALRDVAPGFYIDVGAGDPDHLSVTRAFYDRGWRGLDVEPLPENVARLRAARTRDVVVEAALADAPGRSRFYRVVHAGDVGLSTLDADIAGRSGGEVEPIEVEVTTLASLCAEHAVGEVHFLKIDVEGAEAAVLRGADLRRVRPWIVLVEATRPLSPEPSEAEWEGLLLASGYRFVWFDGLNRFYLAEERHAALARHFRVPPNPFDRYRVADLEAERRLAAAAEEVRAQAERVGRLEAEIAALRAPPPAPPEHAPRRHALLRPLAERVRGFLIGPLRDELTELRARQEAILARLESLAVERPGAGLADALEQVLLTAALERDRR